MSHGALNWPYALQLARVAPGGTSQADGSYTPPQETVTSIKGHVSDISLKELQRLPTGVYSPGGRRLVADAAYDIKAGDEVRVTEADAAVTRWQVQAEERAYALAGRHAGTRRRSFRLERKA